MCEVLPDGIRLPYATLGENGVSLWVVWLRGKHNKLGHGLAAVGGGALGMMRCN